MKKKKEDIYDMMGLIFGMAIAVFLHYWLARLVFWFNDIELTGMQNALLIIFLWAFFRNGYTLGKIQNAVEK